MAYGTASGPDDVERYYTDIRGGRPPTPEHLAGAARALRGDRRPLPAPRHHATAGGGHRRARAQPRRGRRVPRVPRDEAFATVHRRGGRTDARGRHRTRDRDRDGAPLVGDVGRELRRARPRTGAGDGAPAFDFVRSYHDDPGFVSFLAARVADALSGLTAEERRRATVVFSAHSLPDADASRTGRCGACGATPARTRAGTATAWPRRRTWSRPSSASPARDRVAERRSYRRPLVGSADRGVPGRPRVAGRARRWSSARPGSSPTTSRSCTTSTSRRGRSPNEPGCVWSAPRCRTPTRRSSACSPDVVRERLAAPTP